METTTGIIFDVQSYAVYDGPGIRSCVYFKGCPLRCQWCHNPESQAPGPEPAYWRERCAACGRCVAACPERALALCGDRVERDPGLCRTCGACVAACPNDAHEIIGYEAPVDQVAELVIRDRIFYERSGGGVTISGGEPCFQPDFLFALLAALKSRGVHTAIETCGFFPAGLIGRLLETADLFLYDLKHPDPEAHRAGTGADNVLIRENFVRLLAAAGPERVAVRVPLVPGFNDGKEAIAGLAALLNANQYRGPVHLMPGHAWARGKYERLGRAGSFWPAADCDMAAVERVCAQLADAGLETKVYG